MMLIAGHQIVSRCRLGTNRGAHTMTAQELQQLRYITPLKTAGLGANPLVPTTSTVLVALDVHLAEISQHNTALREPTVKCQCVPCLDVNDARRVLLRDQRRDKDTQMGCKRTGGAVDERRSALIGSFHNVLLAGRKCPTKRIAMSSDLSINARKVRPNYR